MEPQAQPQSQQSGGRKAGQKSCQGEFHAFFAVSLSLLMCTVCVLCAPSYNRVPFVGTFPGGDSGDGGPAVTSQILPNSFSIDPLTNEVYILQKAVSGSGCRIRKVGSDGVISSVTAGPPCVQDPGPFPKAPSALSLVDPLISTFDALGNLFVFDQLSSSSYALYKINFLTNTVNILGTIARTSIRSCQASHDGSVLFYYGDTDIWQRTISTGNEISLANANPSYLTLSPDGLFLYFQSFGSPGFIRRLEIANPSNNEQIAGVSGTVNPTAVDQPLSTAVLPQLDMAAFDAKGNFVSTSFSSRRLYFLDTVAQLFSYIGGTGSQPSNLADASFSGLATSADVSAPRVFASRFTGEFYTNSQRTTVSYYLIEKLVPTAPFTVPDLSLSLSSSTIPSTSGSSSVFTVTRSNGDNPVQWPMGVVITISGTATLNTHFTVSPAFQSSTGIVVIPAGQSSVDITVTATGSSQEGDTIILTVTSSPIFNLVQSSQTLTFSGGSVEGDPHISGVLGQNFDYQGMPKRTYCLLSDTMLQWNVFLDLQQTGPHTFISGPVIKISAFITPDHTVIVNSGGLFKNETGFVTIDGIEVTEGTLIAVDNLSVSFKRVSINAQDLGMKYNDHVAAIAQIVIEGMYSFEVLFVENHFNPHKPDQPSSSLYYRRFIDAKIKVLNPDLRPHGIIGQTAYSRPQDKGRSINDWKIEGTESQYQVDGLLGKDFAFNKFTA